jgi:hypothetical protein
MSAGVVERPLDGFDLSIMGWVRSSGDGFGGALFAQAVAAELQAMGVVDDAIENGVSERWFAEDLMMPSFLIAWCIADAREAE